MDDRTLVSVEYDFVTSTMSMVFPEGAEYEMRDVLSYINDACEGRCIKAVVFRGKKQTHNMQLMPGAGWVSLPTPRIHADDRR
jgi:hypothetical protein